MISLNWVLDDFGEGRTGKEGRINILMKYLDYLLVFGRKKPDTNLKESPFSTIASNSDISQVTRTTFPLPWPWAALG